MAWNPDSIEKLKATLFQIDMITAADSQLCKPNRIKIKENIRFSYVKNPHEIVRIFHILKMLSLLNDKLDCCAFFAVNRDTGKGRNTDDVDS